jgi:hypothetical protein
MRSHTSVHRATTKYFSNSFVFKTKIEKEGLPRGSPAGLGAGGPEFKSRRPDQSILFVLHYLESHMFFLQLLWISRRQEVGFANHSISITSLHCAQSRTQKGRSAIMKLLNSLSSKDVMRWVRGKLGGSCALLERLTAAEIQLRSPPRISSAA